MKNRFTVVYTIFAAFVFIFSLAFFGYNLYSEYSVNYEKSESKFNQLLTDIKYLSNEYPENTAQYAEAVKKAVGNPQALAFLELKRGKQTVLLYPAGKTRQETLSKMTRSFEDAISVNDTMVVLDCNYYLIQPDSIFYYARVSFLMILIITLITVIMIIYISMTENKTTVEEHFDDDDELSLEEVAADEEEVSDNSEIETESEESVDENSDNQDVVSEEPDTEETVEANTETEETSAPEATVETRQDETAAPEPSEEKVAAATPAESAAPAQNNYEEPVSLPIDEIQPSSGDDIPSGLYNTETGIGWESYLLPRLNNEIDRATASEIDLSLFIIKLPEHHLDSDEYKNVCRYLTIQFQFRDLLFEYKDDSIVAIKISMDVDSAISFAEKLFADIQNIINNKHCFIGITSRSIRMVTGERLMLEADQAVEHAVQDPDSPIIAFRVDSDKYRQMMDQN